MAWTDSAVFVQTVLNPMTVGVCGTSGTITLPTGYSTTGGFLTDTIKAALFNNSITPSSTDTMLHIGYNASGGQWLTANEVTGTGWSAGGVAIGGSKAYAVSSNTVAFSNGGTTTASGVTISGAYGTLVYDSSISAGTVASQGICYNYFGGTQSVTGGTFTIAWNAAGIFDFSVTTP